MKKIYVESLGCAKNQVDSEVLLSYAGEEGYVRVENPEEADVVVVNTCGFIESAKTESINTFFSLKERCPNAKMVMAGCLAQRYGHEMELEEADAIFGNHDLSLFPSVLKDIENDRERDDRAELLSFPRSAYLKISEGCNHCCSYCAIPVIRGSLRSRPFEKVVAEAERLIREGIYEINVIAQDLGAYGLDLYGRSRFTELMETLAHIEGDFVLRMLYIHPDTFPMDLIDLVAREEKILPYFDIPVQHADERILKAMRRSGSGDKYASLFAAIREKNSDAVIRTTLMLGFPGEDRAAFETLIAFIRKAQPDWMGSFTYSREEDTPAYSMRNKKEHDKAHKEALKWQKELEEVQSEITAKRLQRFVGKEYWALVEEKIEGEDLAIGRIYSEAPDVDGLTVIMGRDMKSGDKVRVGIRSVRGVDLEGVKID